GLDGQEPQEPHERKSARDAASHGTLTRDHERGLLPQGLVRDTPGLDQDVEVLFGRQATDVQHDSRVVATREPAPPAVVAPARIERAGVHAAPPHRGVGEAASLELRANGSTRRQRLLRRVVEPGEPPPYRGREYADAVVTAVLGEVRVERRHQRQPPPQRVAPARKPQGAFGMDVNQVRPKRVEELGDRPCVREREPDRRVQGERNRQDPPLLLVVRGRSGPPPTRRGPPRDASRSRAPDRYPPDPGSGRGPRGRTVRTPAADAGP